MIHKFVSLKRIISKIYLYTNTNYEISENFIVELCADALSMIGAYSQYTEVPCELELDKDGRAKLPLAFEKLVDIRYNNNPVYWATNNNANEYGCSDCKIQCSNSAKYTFYINNNFIISNITENNTNTTDNKLCIVYLGIPTDDEGYPLVPDDVYYEKALMSYVISILDWQEWRRGKTTDKVFEHSQREWQFYVNAARGSANIPDTAQMERIKNVLKRLLPVRNDYATGFKNFNQEEKLNLR